jgi:hypothetical protein
MVDDNSLKIQQHLSTIFGGDISCFESIPNGNQQFSLRFKVGGIFPTKLLKAYKTFYFSSYILKDGILIDNPDLSVFKLRWTDPIYTDARNLCEHFRKMELVLDDPDIEYIPDLIKIYIPYNFSGDLNEIKMAMLFDLDCKPYLFSNIPELAVISIEDLNVQTNLPVNYVLRQNINDFYDYVNNYFLNLYLTKNPSHTVDDFLVRQMECI